MMRKKIIPIILAAALLLAGLGIYISANRSRCLLYTSDAADE